jgi:ribosomal protein L7/L12
MEKKNKCDICGKDLIQIIEGHSLILTCSEHGGRIATTHFSDMELDSTNYEIFLQPNNTVNKETIKIVSEITSLNFLESKKVLESKTAVSIYKVKDEAVREISRPEEIIKIARRLKEVSLDFYILPEFKYEI